MQSTPFIEKPGDSGQRVTFNELSCPPMWYFLQFSYTLSIFSLRLFFGRKKAKAACVGYLRQIENKLNGQIDTATFKKIVKSHSTYLFIVNNPFTQLHGRNTTPMEQERSINYFICSSYFDNFWDDQSHTYEQIEQITFNPNNYSATTFPEKAFLQSHLFLLNSVQNHQPYLAVLRKEFEAQAASMQQFDQNISNDQIQHITFEKGGNAVLMCRYYLDVQPTKQEEDTWYILGTLIQLSNDLFDIHKDLQQGIQTLATRCTEIYAMETFYQKQVDKLKANIHSLPYSRAKKFRFSIAMAATYCLGFTAIQHLQNIQGFNKTLPPLSNLSHKQLMIDLEKPKQIWVWARQVYKHAKLD